MIDLTQDFRQERVAKKVAQQIAETVKHPWTIMEVCGGQTHSILQYGIDDLLPELIELVHGPGCPVCVTPIEIVDKAIAIASRSDVIFCSFGDMLRVPGTSSDLLDVKARGGDVRLVYSPLDAVGVAQNNPDKEIVFFAVGFETTAPANAMAVWQANQLGLTNFSVLCSHVTVPPVMASLLESPENKVQAFLGPGHVCSIMGETEYEYLVSKFKIPIVISGFEPLDILDGILRCVVQLERGESRLENRYKRAVRREGNKQAVALLNDVFEVIDRPWRGLGAIARSGYGLSPKYKQFDAQIRFSVEDIASKETTDCMSGDILRGLKKPFDCPAFGCECTPETPLGATMVSPEGTCANYYKFSRLK